MSRLPVCAISHPTCGSCGLETRFDDVFFCEGCGLNYGDGEDQTEAEFIDPDTEVCDHACDNYWHGHGRIAPGRGYNCQPCPLPAGHETSEHWHPCEPT